MGTLFFYLIRYDSWQVHGGLLLKNPLRGYPPLPDPFRTKRWVRFG